jgi:hypothetical protein
LASLPIRFGNRSPAGGGDTIVTIARIADSISS